MAHSPTTRISDDDRRTAADELRLAHNQGRLSLTEYDDRLQRVGEAKTYADLRRLFGDLPVTQRESKPRRAPKWVRVVWLWWTVTLAINLAVWALVRFQFAADVHFWPMWLVIPTVAIAAVTYPAAAKRANRTPTWRR
ncbi:DUF1707 domain-containing protein [Actinokineospora soli]|uniref:DUF1707 domain-containing protein n=1 Tax=Actinokineospora soli TaxID=1048753 RepID=A0ABW2TNU4_9PSEU